MMYPNYKEFLYESSISDLVKSVSGVSTPFSDICDADVDRKDLNILVQQKPFIKAIKYLSLWCGVVTDTKDIENLVSKRLRYVCLYSDGLSELDNPEYIMLQKYRNKEWEEIKVYHVDGNMKNFYDTLSARTIELKGRIYSTSNSGNDWYLKNGNKNSTFKPHLDKEELNDIVKSGIKMDIVD